MSESERVFETGDRVVYVDPPDGMGAIAGSRAKALVGLTGVVAEQVGGGTLSGGVRWVTFWSKGPVPEPLKHMANHMPDGTWSVRWGCKPTSIQKLVEDEI